MANREINKENQQLRYFFNKKKVCSDLILVVLISAFIAFLKLFGAQHLSYAYAWLCWTIICVTGYGVYAPTLYYGEIFLTRYASRIIVYQWLQLVILAVFASLLFSFVVPLINFIFFDIEENYFLIVPKMIPQCLVIGGFITCIGLIKDQLKRQKQQLFEQSVALNKEQQKVPQVKTEKLATLLAKIPLEKRGNLLCLEMDDHYLTVHTDKGKALILMRFKDALALIEDYPGVQTHRSWWVALDAIQSEQREGRKILVKLTNGLLVPISKTYLANVKSLISS